MSTLSNLIEGYFDDRENLSPLNAPPELQAALETVYSGLESGTYRVATPESSGWEIHPWLKKAILLGFRITPCQVMSGSITQYYDKVPLRFDRENTASLLDCGARIVPPATIRRGTYIGPNAVIMPSYVNIGAYVGEGTMVDTWATVGSCAQIGRNVHISGGAGIGGVLEPLQAEPTIIEDDCFIGARSEVVEGVIVEQGAVLSMGVFVGQSTRIYDRVHKTTHQGRIPANAVVVPGTVPSSDGDCHLSAAIIVKYADSKTRQKVGLNHLLREAQDAIL